MTLLDDLLARMRATPELSAIQIVENEAVDDETFVFKVRAAIIPNVLQIRFLADKHLERYWQMLKLNHQGQVVTLAMMIAGIVLSRKAQLSVISSEIPTATQEQSTESQPLRDYSLSQGGSG